LIVADGLAHEATRRPAARLANMDGEARIASRCLS